MQEMDYTLLDDPDSEANTNTQVRLVATTKVHPWFEMGQYEHDIAIAFFEKELSFQAAGSKMQITLDFSAKPIANIKSWILPTNQFRQQCISICCFR
jgi:hypothetical protein